MADSQITPPHTLHLGLNNVYGRAQFKKDAGVTRYLGQFNDTDLCVRRANVLLRHALSSFVFSTAQRAAGWVHLFL